MKGLLVIMLVMAGLGADAAQAARESSAPSREVVELPSETLAAFDDIAAASEARRRGEPLAHADAALAAGIDRLAASFGSIEGDAAFGVAVGVQSRLLGRELASRMRTGVALDPLIFLLPFERLQSAKVAGARQRLHEGARGPSHQCTLQLLACYEYCSELRGFFTRAGCGLDCEIDYVACLSGAIGDIVIETIDALSPEVVLP